MSKLFKTITLTILTAITLTTFQTTITNTSIKQSYTYTEELKTNEDLTIYAEKFLKDTYNIDLDIPVSFKYIEDENILGQFIYNNSSNNAGAIEIIIAIDDRDQHAIERTLRHELTHYYLYEFNMGYKDGEADFEQENYRNAGKSNFNNEFIILDSKIEADCCY